MPVVRLMAKPAPEGSRTVNLAATKDDAPSVEGAITPTPAGKVYPYPLAVPMGPSSEAAEEVQARSDGSIARLRLPELVPEAGAVDPLSSNDASRLFEALAEFVRDFEAIDQVEAARQMTEAERRRTFTMFAKIYSAMFEAVIRWEKAELLAAG
jgi:hypothetical protein